MEANQKLMDAAVQGDLGSVLAAIEEGADVNYTNGDGRSVLMRCAKRGRTEVVKVLLLKGANVNASFNGCLQEGPE